MARATTEKFHEMTLEFDTSGTVLPPASVAALSVSAAASAIFTMSASDIAYFTAGDTVIISGGVSNFSTVNGSKVVGVITGATFPLNPPAVTTGSPLTTTIMLQPKIPTGLVWSKLCGLTSRTVNRTTTIQTTQVPDCDDESLPAAVERAVQSAEVTVAGTGVWAAQSHGTLMTWWRAGTTKNIRIGNVKAPSGTILYEIGPAYLTQLNNVAQYGQKVTADIQIEFDGMPLVQNAP
jgi:Phage tail tube protein